MNNSEIENLVIDLYVNQGKGQVACGKAAGLSVNQVKQILIKNNIHIRNKHESIMLANKMQRNKYQYDDTYFQRQTSSMAWILGFIASDGSIRKGENEIKIGLSKVDSEILERIKEEMSLQMPVKFYTTTEGYECCRLQWTNEQHKKDLATYHIVPQKTYCLLPPDKLDRKYWIDYIRGYFDGDGSINYLQSNHALCWQICAATSGILQWIIDFLYEEYNIPKVNIHQMARPNGPLYYFQYSTNATKMIYKILYTPNSLYLQRKKDKFEEVLTKIN